MTLAKINKTLPEAGC